MAAATMSDTASDDMFSLAGKTAIVTGGTRGIGEMIATGFLQRGVKTYITSRKADACEAMQEKLSAFGEVVAAPYDLASSEGIEAFAGFMAEREGKIDILVNNAGATWGADIDKLTEEQWDKVMDLNVKSLFFLSQKLLPQLRAAAVETGRGRIINIASIEGHTVPMQTDSFVYPTSKAAVNHLTRVMARRLAGEKITVNAIAPGPFESKMTAFMLASDEGKKMVGGHMPLGRIGQPDDMIGLSVFLASRAADYITGVSIPLDGGYVSAR
ncbi:MAG: SDR family oxidoreductase [Pseudomonadota bacterium]